MVCSIFHFFISHGYNQSLSDHLLFLKFCAQSTIISLLVYVDDIVLPGDNIFEITQITSLLDQMFKIKDLGNSKFFLGLEIDRNKFGIHLCQPKYTLDILLDTDMLASRPISTPIDYCTRSQGDSSTILTDPFAY